MPDDQRAANSLLTFLEDASKLGTFLQTRIGAEDELSCQACFLISVARPLRRRRLSVLRPPAVDILARKPIFLSLLRL